MLRNNQDSYGSVAKLFHWLVFFLVVGMIAVGFYMEGLPVSPDKIRLYGWHKSLGVLLLSLMLLRLAWRLTNATPRLSGDLHKIYQLAAHAGHYSLYLLLILMPLSGWLMSSSAGFSVSVFGWFTLPDLVEADKSLNHFFHTAHFFIAWAIIIVVVVHVAAALWHHFCRHDNVLKRMMPGG